MNIFILLAIIISFQVASFGKICKNEWIAYKAKYKKKYSSKLEDKFRAGVFRQNKLLIDEENLKYENGERTYKLGLNKYSDMHKNEFSRKLNGLKKSKKSFYKLQGRSQMFTSPKNIILPENVDWRKKGYVTEVVDQGICGSCWAFSATGALSGQYFKKTGILENFSVQNLLDCSSKYGNTGCAGGFMNFAFQYLKDNKGIDREKCYPYIGLTTECRYQGNVKGINVTGFVNIQPGDEEGLKAAVATVGPITGAVDSATLSLLLYSGGVYSDRACSTDVNHAVLIVGYGTEKTKNGNLDYWLVKNTWGPLWGEDGYVRIARNKGDICGIATTCSYPTIN